MMEDKGKRDGKVLQLQAARESWRLECTVYIYFEWCQHYQLSLLPQGEEQMPIHDLLDPHFPRHIGGSNPDGLPINYVGWRSKGRQPKLDESSFPTLYTFWWLKPIRCEQAQGK